MIPRDLVEIAYRLDKAPADTYEVCVRVDFVDNKDDNHAFSVFNTGDIVTPWYVVSAHDVFAYYFRTVDDVFDFFDQVKAGTAAYHGDTIHHA